MSKIENRDLAKKDIKIVFMCKDDSQETREVFSHITKEVMTLVSKHEINLISSLKIVPDMPVVGKILYYSKATNNEFISDGYLKFIDELIDCFEDIEKRFQVIHLPME